MTWQLLILEKEPPMILRLPQKCSQVTGKTIKGRNLKVQFFLDTLYLTCIPLKYILLENVLLKMHSTKKNSSKDALLRILVMSHSAVWRCVSYLGGYLLNVCLFHPEIPSEKIYRNRFLI